MKPIKFIDLFSGAGGFTEGLLLAGDSDRRFELVVASDIHLCAELTHTKRFKEQLGLNYEFLTEDIRSKIFVKKLKGLTRKVASKQTIDMIVGGPPCQGYSVFGPRDENDPRNDLFIHYLKTIQALKPKYFVMENVPGLATMYEGKAVDRIHSEVADMRPTKYDIVGPIKINASNYGVPQNRERIVFIGYRKGLTAIKEIPSTHAGEPVTVREALDDLSFLKSWESNGYYHENHAPNSHYQEESRQGRLFRKFSLINDDNRLYNHDAARHTPEVIARFAMIEPGKGFDSIPVALWEKHLKSSKKWCVRLDPDSASYTVVTLPDDFVHYKQHRILTVREMARLQSFDDTFVFYGPRSSGGGGKGNKKRNKELPQYTQVGNAVPPLMAKAIGDVLLNHF